MDCAAGSLAVRCTRVDAGQTKRAGSGELSFVLLYPLAWNVEKKLIVIFGTVPFWVVQRSSAWTSHRAQLAVPSLHLDQHGPPRASGPHPCSGRLE